MTGFAIHPRLVGDCHILGRLGPCHLLLHRNAAVPWFILVPETDGPEPCDLADDERRALDEVTHALSRFVREFFGVPKLNVASIGNIVPQLHVHVVGRGPGDACWPRPVWGHLDTVAAWPPERIREIATALAALPGFSQDVL